MPVFLAALAALSWGTADFIGGLASRQAPARSVVVYSQLVGLTLALIGAPLLGGEPTARDFLWGGAAGLLGSFGLVALYAALAGGKISVVAPVSGVISAGVPLLFGLLIGERPAPTAVVGMTVALVAIWLVSAGEDLAASGIGLALVSGAGFAGFAIVIGQTADTSGLWPLVPARVSSILLIVGFSLLTAGAIRPPRKVGRLVIAAGVGDMAANMLFLTASHRGLLSIAAVVSSMFPAPTVLLGRFVLHEKVRPAQWVGLVLALVAVTLISI
jgi:drug/metabolite transporter (DMT)-like permease